MHHLKNVIEEASLTYLAQLHEGGQSRVLLARQALDDREELVVVKYFHENFLLHYQQERDVLLRLKHEAFPSLCGTIENKKGCGLILEFVPGITLFQALIFLKQKNISINHGVINFIAYSLFSALAYLHKGLEPGVIHGDISPDNIMLTKTGTIKIIDLAASSCFQSTKQQKVAFGKAMYLAPEVLQGGSISFQADMFSCAACIFEILTLTPFRADSMAVQLKRLKRLDGLDERLALVLATCLAPSLELRPADSLVAQKMLMHLNVDAHVARTFLADLCAASSNNER